MKHSIDLDRLHLQLASALETERGSIDVYREALRHAGPASRWLRWKAALEDAQRHEHALLGIMADLGLDPERDSAGRRAVRAVADALLGSMRAARDAAARTAAACECVRLVEQRERTHWELLGQLLAPGSAARAAARSARTRRTGTCVPHWYERAAGARLERSPVRRASG